MTVFTPFEQLEFFVPEPQRAFGEVVQALLLDHFGLSAIQSCDIPGCFTAREREGSSLFQPKYFVGDWQGFQRQQIRAAFQQAVAVRRNPPLRRWVLCVPTAMSPKDVYWFDRWRQTQGFTIEALEGNELLRMLREPQGHRARQMLRRWGATVTEPEGVHVHGRLRVRVAECCSGPSHYLYVSLHHGGNVPIKGLKVELAHSPTYCFGLQQDEREWADEGRGNLNPRRLRARRPLMHQENRAVAVIPIGIRTPLPLHLKLKLSSRGAGCIEQHLTLDRRALDSARTVDFMAGSGLEPARPRTGSISAFAA